MASGIGDHLPPTDDTDWLAAAWRYLNARLAVQSPREAAWLDRPVVQERSASTPEISAQLDAIPGIHPGARYLVAQARTADPDAGPQTVIARWSGDPAEWGALDWFSFDAAPIDLGSSRLITWRLYLDSYMRAPRFTGLGPDGEVCGAHTRGLLRLRHIRDGKRYVTLKESAVWGEEPADAYDLPAGDLFAADGSGTEPARLFDEVARPAIAAIGRATWRRS